MQKLPNPDKALIDIDKLSGYCLNSEHQDGQHKARVFKSALSLGTDAIPTKRNEYGQKYVIDFEINHSDKMAKIRSAWMVRNNENFPRLITCYVL